MAKKKASSKDESIEDQNSLEGFDLRSSSAQTSELTQTRNKLYSLAERIKQQNADQSDSIDDPQAIETTRALQALIAELDQHQASWHSNQTALTDQQLALFQELRQQTNALQIKFEELDQQKRLAKSSQESYENAEQSISEQQAELDLAQSQLEEQQQTLNKELELFSRSRIKIARELNQELLRQRDDKKSIREKSKKRSQMSESPQNVPMQSDFPNKSQQQMVVNLQQERDKLRFQVAQLRLELSDLMQLRSKDLEETQKLQAELDDLRWEKESQVDPQEIEQQASQAFNRYKEVIFQQEGRIFLLKKERDELLKQQTLSENVDPNLISELKDKLATAEEDLLKTKAQLDATKEQFQNQVPQPVNPEASISNSLVLELIHEISQLKESNNQIHTKIDTSSESGAQQEHIQSLKISYSIT